MTKPKPKADPSDAPIEDPDRLRSLLQALFEAEVEFPIKVEGTSTLPYSSRIQEAHFSSGTFILKLVRPLPHELMKGATFRMTFAVEEQRLEGLITFLGREAYLQYRFQVPVKLQTLDRRRHPRFPFRPRENAYVIAQDTGIPGLGVAGPLVNISQGGFALRVDRVLKLDDGMRIPPRTALFDRGKGFNRIRIQELPKLPSLDVRGLAAHVQERGTELILGLSFGVLAEEEAAALAQALELRGRMYRGGSPASPQATPAAPRPARGQEAEAPAPEPDAQAAAGETRALVALQRRTARVMLVMAAGDQRDLLARLLRGQGFHRLEVLETLEQVRPQCEADGRRTLPRLLLADLALAHTGDAEPLAAVRVIEHHLGEIADLPTVILCEAVDPTLLLAQASHTRFLAYETLGQEDWCALLDELLAARIAL